MHGSRDRIEQTYQPPTIKQDKSKLCFCVGAITEKIARISGYNNTISAGGTVNALKNLIISSSQINERSKIAYFCGDNVAYDLDLELKKEGLKILDVEEIDTHGGSLRIYGCHKDDPRKTKKSVKTGKML